MKTELPEPGEYYRPTRARELREEADRLERWNRWLRPFVFALVTVPLFLLWCWALMRGGSGSLALPFALGFAGSIGLYLALPRRADRLRAQADALEAEHAARYGSLPEEVP